MPAAQKQRIASFHPVEQSLHIHFVKVGIPSRQPGFFKWFGKNEKAAFRLALLAMLDRLGKRDRLPVQLLQELSCRRQAATLFGEHRVLGHSLPSGSACAES